jgi:hypothetical protein
MEMVTFTPELFYSGEKSLWNLLNNSLYRPHVWSGHWKKRKISCLYQVLNCDSLVIQPIAYLLYNNVIAFPGVKNNCVVTNTALSAGKKELCMQCKKPLQTQHSKG